MAELFGLSVELIAFLFVIALVAGFIDTLAGGGGLIALPALLMAGISPIQALATNKLQGTAGTLTATAMMIRHKRVDRKSIPKLMLAAFVGSAIGTVIVQLIDTSLLEWIIPLVLAGILVFFICYKPSSQDLAASNSTRTFKQMAVPIVGLYDGMFGPGTGSFFAVAGISFGGKSLLDATALAKCLNFATNISSLIIFALAGQVIWATGFVMMIGQFIGAWLGSHTLYKIDVRVLRWIVVVMCSAMLIRYLLG